MSSVYEKKKDPESISKIGSKSLEVLRKEKLSDFFSDWFTKYESGSHSYRESATSFRERYFDNWKLSCKCRDRPFMRREIVIVFRDNVSAACSLPTKDQQDNIVKFNNNTRNENAMEFLGWFKGRLRKLGISVEKAYLDLRGANCHVRADGFDCLRVQATSFQAVAVKCEAEKCSGREQSENGHKKKASDRYQSLGNVILDYIKSFNTKYSVEYVDKTYENVTFYYDGMQVSSFGEDNASVVILDKPNSVFTIQMPTSKLLARNIEDKVTFGDMFNLCQVAHEYSSSSTSPDLQSISRVYPGLDIFTSCEKRTGDLNVFDRGEIDIANIITILRPFLNENISFSVREYSKPSQLDKQQFIHSQLKKKNAFSGYYACLH